MKKVTIKDIAKKAGVANSTVTNALNPNSKKISDIKRKEILKIVEELNYRPMASAQNLSKKDRKVVGFFIRASHEFSSGIVDQKLIYYMNKFANDFNLELITIITSFDSEKSFNEIQQKIQTYNFSHIIIQGLDSDLDILQKVLNLNVQKILIELPVTNKNTVFISTNNYLAQENLINIICKENVINNVLYITGDKNAYVSSERLKGFESAISKLAISYKIVEGTFDKNKAIELVENIDFSKYDFIACGSDIVAGIVTKKCKEQKLENIIIAGFDGSDFLEYLNYKIYTVVQDIEFLCEHIINMILTDNFKSKLIDFKIKVYK